MALLFFILSSLLVLTVVLFRRKAVTQSAIVLFSAMHLLFTVYCWLNTGSTELDYFTFDHAAILLLTVLSILTVTTVYHSYFI